MRIRPSNFVVIVCLSQAVSLQAADGPVDYLKQIKPVLRERCFACHGALKQSGGLRLDTAALIAKGGDSGSAVDVGSASRSLLIERVTATDESLRMPPDGNPLTEQQIDLLRNWIDQASVSPSDEQPERDPRDHWSFRPPRRPDLPNVKDPNWVLTPVDAFIAAEHDAHGLKPQPAASKQLWLRRVTLDLTGLPPSPEDLSAFLRDDSPAACEKVVNRLLDTQQYGERWGRHWMDIWRYSDAWGLGAEIRNSQKHIWHWRDWIVESLNADLGYDEMLRQMLAADELYPQDFNKLRASGFLARQYFKFNRTVWLDETIEHVSKSMLGITFNCAKCHDHKYDPVSQQDYYAFRAIFEPYQVRTDLLPGEIDVEKAGLPRAFDCNLDAPTFLHLRGDDRNPDKSRPIAAGVPSILTPSPLSIVPIELPHDAVQPGLRPHVVAAYLKDAENRIAAARSELETLQQRMTTASDAAALTRMIKVTENGQAVFKDEISDDFSVERSELWHQKSGRWKYTGRGLQQSQFGASRAVLSLKAEVPADFEARLKFVTTGGDTWKSVGINFDAHGPDHEVLAYLSAFAGGPKSQLSYIQNAMVVYPPQAAQSREVDLNQPHEILVRARGTLINVMIDGQQSLSHRLPFARAPGSFELVAFDAEAEFYHFSVRPLPSDVALMEPANSSPTDAIATATTEQAELMLRIAQKALATANSLPAAILARSAADHAQVQLPPPENLSEILALAARSERIHSAAKADEEVARAELALLKAVSEKQDELKKKLEAAKQSFESAQKAVDETATTYSRLIGAVKTLESNLETAESQGKPFPPSSTGRRSALARWLTDTQNPLTARVAINHIWLRHLGKPLVPTVFDFGRKGMLPTHPQLLDWLAVELVEHQWSMKHIHRLIVLSNTYRMSSSTRDADPATAIADPDNQYDWHGTPIRMEAQTVRDSLLFLAGELDLTLGGPPKPVEDESSRRRSLYYVHSHNDHNHFLSMFDDASVLDCYRRSESIVPQQALALENSPLTATMAAKIAQRIDAETPGLNDRQFIHAAFLRVLSTPPLPAEVDTVLAALAQFLEVARQQGDSQPLVSARTAAILALLNHNEFITVR